MMGSPSPSDGKLTPVATMSHRGLNKNTEGEGESRAHFEARCALTSEIRAASDVARRLGVATPRFTQGDGRGRLEWFPWHSAIDLAEDFQAAGLAVNHVGHGIDVYDLRNVR